MNSRFLKQVAAAAAAACLTLAQQAQGGATIYVNGSNTGPEDGATLETGWNTIAEGVAAMLASNLVSQGGHTLIVGAGTYKETMTFTKGNNQGVGGHCGVSTNLNRVLAQGDVVIDGENTSRNGVAFGEYVYYVHVDGFTITRCNWGMIGDAIYHHVISNMTITACRGGIRLTSGNSQLIGNINRCTIVGNELAGLVSSLGGGMVVRDSIVAYNGVGALELLSSQGDIALRNTVLYGNAIPYFDEATNIVTSKAAIEALPSSPYAANKSVNVVTDPVGYVQLHPLNVLRVKEGSPIFTAATDGGCAGAAPGNAYATVAVAAGDRTLYVAPTPAGDDDRDAAAAQNPATPWATLGRAAAAVRDGDTVRVAPGLYVGGVTLSNTCPLGGSVAFVADGGDVTVNGAGQTAALALCGAENVSFNGFSFTGATHGVTLSRAYNSAFTDCRFAGNAQDGMNAKWSSGAAFAGCDFSGNGYRGVNLYDAAGMGHVFSFADCAVYSNRVTGTTGYSAMDVRYVWFPTIDRCRVYDNNLLATSGYGIDLTSSYESNVNTCYKVLRNTVVLNCRAGVMDWYSGSKSVVENCVFALNRAWGYQHYSNVNGAFPVIRNCVFAGNGTYGFYEANKKARLLHCAFYDNASGHLYNGTAKTVLNTAEAIDANYAGGVGNIVPADAARAGFRDPAAGDFRLRSGSVLVDAGTNTLSVGNLADLYGNPRVIGDLVDIGVHERPRSGGTVLCVR